MTNEIAFLFASTQNLPFKLSLDFSIIVSDSRKAQAPNCNPPAMAAVIMASSKPIIPLSSSLPTTTRPRLQIPQLSLPIKILPKITKTQLARLSSSTLKSLSLLAATSFTFAPPSLAEEIEKAALFDFDLTLPIMMVQFLILMVTLDKLYFSPLGKFMDERDAAIKEKLGSVKDTSTEVKQLEEQAAAVMRAARAEISAALNKMKNETQAELEEKLAAEKKKIEAELQEALGNLEKQREETIKSLDSQISALSDEIVKKVLPAQ
ncbi:ATP synthase subunit b', chloroplastic [Manihot esculenta]|uniref:ATP synthase subunit b', chloroplastic n=1 Tax=Manihot esculenta TaxID=3983 RepID=A0A2C9UCX5_MANES|nr:ATP synthase subunit b', chloroplastic [Manihot esculenta]